MTPVEMIRAMQAAGASAEVQAIALQALAEAAGDATKLRAAAAERKRRQRNRDRAAWDDLGPSSRDGHDAASRDSHGTAPSHGTPSPPRNGPPSPEPPTPPLTPPLPSPPNPPGELFEEDVAVSDYPRQAFDRWYADYPHKVGRLKAKASFERIRKGRLATFAELVEGVRRYKLEKPLDTPWANPATWLNQGRWSDERGDLAGAAVAEPDPVLARLKELNRGQP